MKAKIKNICVVNHMRDAECVKSFLRMYIIPADHMPFLILCLPSHIETNLYYRF